ncbi:FAD-linked oxidoreductase-like protein [Jimgerdemannia flammicorona]|uniref:Proline dehydrogenase n=1 Tax=Jimgerdemannia flammicorona TaxID=994334 RepID=A0A433Q1C6_9FUNG|nr:FAD-linked oxidoreductase-like protein [Jimgerdemannia flammicorona]
MYLKEALFKLEMDVERARRGGFVFAAKLVRGAYLISERKRATDLHLPDPIQPDLAATHASYDAGVSLLLRHVVQIEGEPSPSVMFMVASHNKESIIAACTEMERRGIRPEEGHVLFGQLLGRFHNLTLSRNPLPRNRHVRPAQLHAGPERLPSVQIRSLRTGTRGDSVFDPPRAGEQRRLGIRDRRARAAPRRAYGKVVGTPKNGIALGRRWVNQSDNSHVDLGSVRLINN